MIINMLLGKNKIVILCFALCILGLGKLNAQEVETLSSSIKENIETKPQEDTVADKEALGEVIITALGIKREKKALGYAVQEIRGNEVYDTKDANLVNSLSGKIAGLDIQRGNSMGASSNVIIRGFKSLNGNNQALFVVDGVPIDNGGPQGTTNSTDQRTGRGGYDYGNGIADINPDDIESISVLKGAAATALYGSRASNGVILVSTKKKVIKKD